MYAIIANGGKQYKISEGNKVKLEYMTAAEGEDIQLKDVLVVDTGQGTIVGAPFVKGAYVQGKVVAQGKDDKVTVFKYKRRKDYKVKRGHRQPFTELLIEKIILEA
ncbi:MAG: 50S ribosomal protein L21 [Syntrophorhabdus sp. PtaU1.Bin058]|nr:MAG: 50S ribosomal protein L21 [Syntrophorhabdus sp. PtaU1.Bin058]